MVTITLCSSAKFFDILDSTKIGLESKGYKVEFPSSADLSGLDENARIEKRGELIRRHCDLIDRSDAVYVANYYKNGIRGYIGGNVFLEMFHAFELKMPIFLLNKAPKEMGYFEEICAMKPVAVGSDWDLVDKLMCERYGDWHSLPESDVTMRVVGYVKRDE